MNIIHGAMVDEDCREEATIEKIINFNTLAKKNVGVVFFSDRWYKGIKFPTNVCNQINATGATPFIRMQPADDYDGGKKARKHSQKNIAAGKFDKELKQYAADVKAFGKIVIAEYGVEVNGGWFGWSMEGSSKYVKAYKHVAKLFAAADVTNIRWALQLDITDNDNGAKWYPGDFISWLGTSCYGAYEYGQEGCISELRKHYAKFAAISKTARLGIFEWGLGDAKDTTTTLQTLATNPTEFDRIELLQIWNEKLCDPSDPIPGDGRINANPENLKAYQDGIANPVYVSTYV
jgi:hypothetical protein